MAGTPGSRRAPEPTPSGGPAPERAAANWALPTGAAVEVRSRYLGTWTNGFELAERVDEGYRVRRRSDGSVLPGVFAPADVRRPQLGLVGWPAGATPIWS